MIPKNHENRKLQVDLRCPTCGMDLTRRFSDGFVRDGETYCCRACANGTGCTCDRVPAKRRKTFNRPGDIGHRNPENSARDRNANQEVDTSGNWFSNRRETAKAPARYPRRGDRLSDRSKAPRSQSEPRDSTREQARGRSEYRGSLNTKAGPSRGANRLTRTGSKGK